MKSISLFFILFVLFFACQEKKTNQHDTSKSKIKINDVYYSEVQKEEFRKVVTHFSKNRNDSLKLKSALFLIKDIHRQYFYIGEQLDKFNNLFTILGKMPDAWRKDIPWYGNHVNNIIDSLEKIQGDCCGQLRKVYDKDIIKADLIIENIELSFKVWGEPWSKHYTFEQFCEYILPYRATHEKLEKWRAIYFEKLKELAVKIKDSASVLELAKEINNVSQLYYQDGINRYPVNISPSNLLKTSFGDCRSIANYKLLRMRSMGIATAIDFVPQWANIDHGHYWNSLIDNSGKSVNFMIALNDVQAQTAYNSVIPKVYRYTYSANPKVEKLLEFSNSNCPAFFLNPCYVDVTEEYIKTNSFSINLTHAGNSAYVFLCLFNKGFNAIDFAEIQDGKATFNKIGRNALYFPMYYDRGKFIAADVPFFINNQGDKVDVICQEDKRQTINMNRKYHMEVRKANWLQSLVGGEFQLSNDRNFNTYVVASKINKIPSQHRETISPVINKKYRYARFLFSPIELDIKYWGDGASIAEITFIDKQGNELNGTPYGTKGKPYNEYLADKAFDKDPLTFFEDARTEGEKYVAIDFGIPRSIGEIKFLARNDMNNIQKGDQYELMYYNGKEFVSLGSKMSTDTNLVYSNVPFNAVFWLKDLSAGNEERIFTYDQNKQVWW